MSNCSYLYLQFSPISAFLPRCARSPRKHSQIVRRRAGSGSAIQSVRSSLDPLQGFNTSRQDHAPKSERTLVQQIRSNPIATTSSTTISDGMLERGGCETGRYRVGICFCSWSRQSTGEPVQMSVTKIQNAETPALAEMSMNFFPNRQPIE